jgi:hypothetical protein
MLEHTHDLGQETAQHDFEVSCVNLGSLQRTKSVALQYIVLVDPP